MLITPAYAALFALLFVALSVRTLMLRRKRNVAVGHGDDPALHRATRVHGNFAEYVPISLLLIFFIEIQGADKIWIHALGLALLAGRVAHAYGVSQLDEELRYRKFGMAITLAVIIITSLRLLLGYAWQLGG